MPEPPFNKTSGSSFIELSSIDSTNNYALTQIHEGLAQHGMAFFAHEQVAGKGQRNKSWTAEKKTSLLLSIILDPSPLQLTRQFQLSACVAVAACEFLNKYADNQTRIKWPNDLYWHDRKAGGILIENVIGSRRSEARSQEQEVGGPKSEAGSREQKKSPASNSEPPATNWRWAVIGIGININQASFPADLKNPISLKQLTGKDFNPVELAKEFCIVFNKNFQHLVTNGFDDIYKLYNSWLYKKDQVVKLRQGNRLFQATIKAVSPTGRLVVQHAMEEEFEFGAVDWVIPSLSVK